ncbi:TonB-dependent receptor [bacterium]|nr:TonB-dependent receptor [bacterium]
MSRFPARSLALLALLLMLGRLQAAPTLAPTPALLGGRLLDATTGEPVIGAHLLLSGQDARTLVSDAQGMFLVPNLQPGDVVLNISHVAYEAQQRTLRIQEGQPLRITLLLEPLVRSATDPVEIRVERAPSVHRIDAREIDRSDWQDVGDAVRTLPGVLVYDEGGQGGRKTISLRGSKPTHVRVRVDGVIVNNGDGEAVDLGQIPLEGVESIEVHPSTQPGAPGGVVEITTRHQVGTPFSRFSLEGSQPNAMSASASAGIAGIGLYLQGQRSEGDFRYVDERGLEQRRINNRRDKLSGLLRFERTFTSATRITSSISGSWGEQGSPGPLYQPPTPEATQLEQRYRSDLTLEHNWGRGISSATLFAGARNRSYRSPSQQQLPGSSEPVNHVPADLKEEGRHAGIFLRHDGSPLPADVNGAAWSSELGSRWERYESINQLSNGVAVSQTEGEVDRLAMHGELYGRVQRFALGWKWRAGVKARYERLRDQHPGETDPFEDGWVTGRLHLQAGPRQGGWSMHSSVGNAVLPVPFTSRFLIESMYSLGNPMLDPERVEEFSGGMALRSDLGPIRSAVTLDLYHRRTRDLIVWRRNFRGQYFPDNVGVAEADGIVLGITGSHTPWHLDAGGSFTWQQVHNRTHNSIYRDNWVPFQPAWYGNVQLGIGASERLRGNLAVRFAGRRYSTESNLDPLTISGGGLDPYGVLDLGLERTIRMGNGSTRLVVQAGMDNATDTRYELLDRMPMPGRTYHLGIKLERGHS